MSDTRRDQLIRIIERELIGPDPIDAEGMIQENGEEILTIDPPRTRYLAGILFPRETTVDKLAETDPITFQENKSEDTDSLISAVPDDHASTIRGTDYLEESEELINRSNARQQSAMSITAAVVDTDVVYVEVNAGSYQKILVETELDQSGKRKKVARYPRTAITWDSRDTPLILPGKEQGVFSLAVGSTDLQFHVTYRYNLDSAIIYTFTLENAKILTASTAIHDSDCYFQAGFKLKSAKGFHPLPEADPINTDDEDYMTNQLLYRDVRSYAVGHGCSPQWEEIENKVVSINSAIFPEYEINPIVPIAIPNVSLEMKIFSDLGDATATFQNLETMCNEYQTWIRKLERDKVPALSEKLRNTALLHIEKCNTCLARMRSGLELLRNDDLVRVAFQLMNRAMLLQQLHYNLPLQKWTSDEYGNLSLERPVPMPNFNDETTWFNKEHKLYGRWRPFQIGFILMNLHSMRDRKSSERNIVDLIWFPTGGGKTEAYLGLSAYAIFMRRLLNKDDSGTSIIMRYTLRLLTAQQYDRAAAMICACDIIRREKETLLGKTRISIGLWVGQETTPNKMSEAINTYNKLLNGTENENPFVMSRCPWCGAEMGPVQIKEKRRALPGYRSIRNGNKRKFLFQCNNTENGCDFSKDDFPLPLHIVDEDIYENTPTLLLGTVDKFALIPYKPDIRRLFGYKDGAKDSSPDLIIQDELHLISGPLGSMVGHYETLIHELCIQDINGFKVHPKIIASTATISRAKDQCHSLYGCGRENVFQFPPPGLDADDSFFAKEDKEGNGRRFVGILATAAPSDNTTAIRLYASLLYGAKALVVDNEASRDPYFTNIAYFNAIRELGQAATWVWADITQYLDTIYRRRLEQKKQSVEEYRKNRRYITNSEELTSRINSTRVKASLDKLSITYPPEKDEGGKATTYPVDICLATNMISVGLDVQRLGLITVNGQPKTTSEYIQTTSRVGRDMKNAPGIVFILYKPGHPRDRSHYEQFVSYHSRIYSSVEPTSVTPFSAPLRERALHAILIGLMRMKGSDIYNRNQPILDRKLFSEALRVIEERVMKVEREEVELVLEYAEHIARLWSNWSPQVWADFIAQPSLPLMFPLGSGRNIEWGENRSFPTPTSLRSVDVTCEVRELQNGYNRGDAV